MINAQVSISHFGPVYARKIDLYVWQDALNGWSYLYSTNAAKTLKAAKALGEHHKPDVKIKACFSE